MVVKLIFGVCIVAFTTLCGYLFSRKFRRRKDFLLQFKEFNERFLAEITYQRRPINAFVASYSYKGEFDGLLKVYSNVLDKRENFASVLDIKKDYPFLKEDERQIVLDYFLMLGKGDSLSQKGYFSATKERLEKAYYVAESDCKKYVNLYIKMGFLCGLMLLILLI